MFIHDLNRFISLKIHAFKKQLKIYYFNYLGFKNIIKSKFNKSFQESYSFKSNSRFDLKL